MVRPSGVVTGVISRSNTPAAIAASARFWLRAAYSSCRARLVPVSPATFSAVWPIAM